jgi:hypothetical protein
MTTFTVVVGLFFYFLFLLLYRIVGIYLIGKLLVALPGQIASNIKKSLEGVNQDGSNSSSS